MLTRVTSHPAGRESKNTVPNFSASLFECGTMYSTTGLYLLHVFSQQEYCVRNKCYVLVKEAGGTMSVTGCRENT